MIEETIAALNMHFHRAQKAYEENITLCEAAVDLKFMTKEKFEEIVDPSKMIGPR